MVWLDLNDCEKQTYIELRLHSPKGEKICLDFNPLRISDAPDWNPMPEEWHCYTSPLTIYRQDYEILLGYFKKIYPIKDAFDGTLELAFDVCFDNWIGKNNWFRIIKEIEQDLPHVDDDTKIFLMDFLQWIKKALKHTSIIVVEGNL